MSKKKQNKRNRIIEAAIVKIAEKGRFLERKSREGEDDEVRAKREEERRKRNRKNRNGEAPMGANTIRAISTTIMIAAKTTNRLRPTISAKAPEGTSASTIVSAHTILRIANCSRVSP